ncbi:hypothetical protein AB0G04_09925 [Actinoplanes sp. NPDC023801]|uniref:hypothetical protein n=1 Tax=Actinoplanes sp. NPDC023801 TaxID=3154595 RepID=UPI0033F645D5
MAGPGHTRYRLLTVVTGTFGAEDSEPSADGYAPLPFAAPLSEQLARQLSRFGYADRTIVRDVPAGELCTAVDRFLASCGPGDVAVVHVLSHGVVDPYTRKLRVVGADGRHLPQTEVERWQTDVEGRGEDRPSVLFLLDICHAGSAARLDWQGWVPDEQRHAWVIAATDQEASAFNGRFTRAAARVLARIADREVDLAAGWEHVPVCVIAQEIRREVTRSGADGLPQRVVGTRVDIASEEWFPFLTNPLYRPSAAALRRIRADVDESARPFLDEVDEVLDWRHFASRASGAGADFPARPGAFRGRSRELGRLAAWLDAPGPGTGMMLVTGSPGAGKSALLGVTVCAAHPVLSPVCEPLWRDRRDDLPAVNDALVAVHARQRRVEEIAASVARQAGLPGLHDSAGGLAGALHAAAISPVVVVDALDEAVDPVAVMTELLLPLAAVCRIVVGARGWPEFAALRERAAAGGTLLDLDLTPVTELRDAVAGYITDLLRPRYPNTAQRAVLHTLAATTATALSTPRPSGDGPRWGEFLVAGLFAHHLLRLEPIADVETAAAAAATVPTALPDVFELDLARTATDQPWLRPVLTALAHSLGSGMPRSLVAVVAPAFRALSDSVTEREVAAALETRTVLPSAGSGGGRHGPVPALPPGTRRPSARSGRARLRRSGSHPTAGPRRPPARPARSLGPGRTVPAAPRRRACRGGRRARPAPRRRQLPDPRRSGRTGGEPPVHH